MKREGIVWGVSGSLILFFLWIVHSFQQEHKVIFDKNYAESVTLKSNEEAIKRDLIFLKQHKNERDFLENKGWFQSKSRLVAGECIEDISGSLNKINYVFEPEGTKNLEGKYNFSVTQVVIEVEAFFDTDIYNFVETLFETFSGILKLRELTLMRKQSISDTFLVNYSDLVFGKIVLEWFAIGKEGDEE